MARVRFTEDFDYKPTAQITVAYLAGWSGTVKRDCAKKAVAANKAELRDVKPSPEREHKAEISGSGEAQ